jgi:hypothetical protein
LRGGLRGEEARLGAGTRELIDAGKCCLERD